MLKYINSLALVAAVGLTVAACSGNGGNPVLHPGPQSTTPGSTAVQYIQIERLSRPAIKEVFEPFQAHQTSNAIEPYADSTIQNDIKGTEDALRAPNTTAGTDYGAALQGVLYPDEYAVNLAGTPPQSGDADPYYFLSYEVNPNRFGGRAPNDDVIYLELAAAFGNLLPSLNLIKDDNEENNCLQSQNIGGFEKPGGQNASKLAGTTFPYLATPH